MYIGRRDAIVHMLVHKSMRSLVRESKWIIRLRLKSLRQSYDRKAISFPTLDVSCAHVPYKLD